MSEVPQLWGPDGQPVSTEGMLVAPHALNFAAVYQLAGRVYPFRWDEALKDNPQNALAMRRDAFYRALLQERIAPTVNRDWEVVPEDEEDPVSRMHAAAMNRCWKATPDRRGLIRWLCEAIWYGRSGVQLIWGKLRSGMTGVIFHEPVNGDSIQFSWDGTPIILVSSATAQKYRATDPDAVVPATDRGAFGLRLYRPEYRRRFIISKHLREASDYFEGEMSGGVHGVGLRSWVYWSGWLRTEVLSWMLSWMQTTGMMDLIIINYADGSASARAAAESNARKISGKLVLLVPRDPREKYAAIEQVSMNTAGVEVLRSLIEGWAERHIERLFVGQSMSAGGGGPGGLEGDGRAEFARDTKYSLLESDAWAIAETLTEDWLRPAYEFNFPGSTVELRVQPVIAERDTEKKVQSIFMAIDKGLEVEESDLRKLLGLREPRPGKKTLGGQQLPQLSTVSTASAPELPSEVGTGLELDHDSVDDLFADLFSLEPVARPELYRLEQPPWKGAVFDEARHRWVNPDKKTTNRRLESPSHTDQQTDSTGPAGETSQKVSEAKSHVRSLLAKAKSVPSAIRRKVTTIIANKYAQLSEKYGPTGAKMVLAGVVLLTPVPLPGTSLMPFAIAEGVVRLRRLFKGRPVAEAAATGYEGEEEGGELDDLASAIRETLGDIYREMGEEPPQIDERALQHVLDVLGHGGDEPAVEYGRVIAGPTSTRKSYIVQPDGGGKPYYTKKPPADKDKAADATEKDSGSGRATEEKRDKKSGHETPALPVDVKAMEDGERHAAVMAILAPGDELVSKAGKGKKKDARKDHLRTLTNHQLLAIMTHNAMASRDRTGTMKGKAVAIWAATAHEVYIERLRKDYGGRLFGGEATAIDGEDDLTVFDAKFLSGKDNDDFNTQTGPGLVVNEMIRRGISTKPEGGKTYVRYTMLMVPGNTNRRNGLYVWPGFTQGGYGASGSPSIPVMSEDEILRLEAAGQGHLVAEKLEDVVRNKINHEEERKAMSDSVVENLRRTAERSPSVLQTLERLAGKEVADTSRKVMLSELGKDEAGRKAMLSELSKDEAGRKAMLSELGKDEAGRKAMLSELGKDEAGRKVMLSELSKDEAGRKAMLIEAGMTDEEATAFLERKRKRGN